MLMMNAEEAREAINRVVGACKSTRLVVVVRIAASDGGGNITHYDVDAGRLLEQVKYMLGFPEVTEITIKKD